ncbi:hypothetical protein BO82DRAFT_398683 [Aspergillus uvarum CBS 121591]|uniref:Alpha-1,3-glucanase/mutanase n=1 Tax=Aspergillus uvarum CBS 121591 TaxID=1448315 RepID=A0A319E2A5_9EURO|nr:hypothetical protein BO82DRAFT_398683 [Aspergillus uvarum CBS 121591]PYH85252.1 hypothetical protein BO82DRAFT_398683 [Aspergillus uvarum CBS 121591]
MALAGGVADSLFSWAAWPNGPNNMNTYIDASYIQYLDKKLYIMPITPWFFTNMPGYDKNWLWCSNDLWYIQWEQALYLAPEFIEIISWNDFGGWSSTEGPYYNNKDNTACNIYNNPEAACWWHCGFPIPAQKITINDPQELMRQALLNIPNLQTSILITKLKILSGSFNSLVDRIYSVVAIGEKIEAEKKKELIPQILGGVFLITRLALAGTVANKATDIYTIVQDPESAPVAILSMLLDFNVGAAAGAATKNGVSAIEFNSMALRRRGMKDSDIKSVGALFKQKMDQLESIVSKCARI